MEQTTQSVKPTVKHKSFDFHTEISWLGGKAAHLTSEGKPQFRVASPPEFKGEAGVWTPEDLFVAAIESCVLMTFSTFAHHRQLNLISYESAADGKLEFVDGSYRFTTVTLKPKIRVGSSDEIGKAEKILESAHRKCLISNSVCARIIIEPEIISAS